MLCQRAARRALAAGVTSVALLVLIYLATVDTIRGQRFEDVVLQATAGRHWSPVLDVLDSITVWSVAAVVIAVIVIGRLRGSTFLGLVAAGVIVLSVATSEVLQHGLPRPLLLSHGYRRTDHSFPSGHTAVAMSMLAALVLVVPHRRRGLAALLGAVWAVGVGVLTLTASWHRPGDTLGADLIVLGCASLGLLVLALRGHVRAARPDSLIPVAALTAIAAVSGPVAVAFTVRVERDIAGTANWLDLRLDAALWAGRCIALTGGVLTVAALLVLLRGLDLMPVSAPAAPPDRPMSRRSDHAR